MNECDIGAFETQSRPSTDHAHRYAHRHQYAHGDAHHHADGEHHEHALGSYTRPRSPPP